MARFATRAQTSAAARDIHGAIELSSTSVPLTPQQQREFAASVDRVYGQIRGRVAEQTGELGFPLPEVKFRYEALRPEHASGQFRILGQVRRYEPGQFVYLDPQAVTDAARQSRFTLDETLIKLLSHELTHLAEVEDPAVQVADIEHREYANSVADGLKELRRQARSGDHLERGTTILGALDRAGDSQQRLAGNTTALSAVSEGMAEHVSRQTVAWAVEQHLASRRLLEQFADGPSAADTQNGQWRYTAGHRFVSGVVRRAELGPSALRGLVSATTKSYDDLPTRDEFITSAGFQQWAGRTYGLELPEQSTPRPAPLAGHPTGFTNSLLELAGSMATSRGQGTPGRVAGASRMRSRTAGTARGRILGAA